MRRPVPVEERSRGLPQVYRRPSRRVEGDILTSETGENLQGPFRWLISTCLAGTVGAVAILGVVYGSTDPGEEREGIMPAIKRLQEGTAAPLILPKRRTAGLNWSAPKTDRLRITTGTTSTRYVIHESIQQKRDGRNYLSAKPYMRIVARLAPVPSNYADVVPPFNPFKLYADKNPVGGDSAKESDEQKNVEIKVVELLGGILPGEDKQELDNREVAALVERARVEEEIAASLQQNAAAGVGGVENSEEPSANGGIGLGLPGKFESDVSAINSTVLTKSIADAEVDIDALEGAKKVVVTAAEGDTLKKILTQSGADTWQVDAMVEVARTVFENKQLSAGQQVHITLLPSLTDPERMEPTRFSLFSPGQTHDVTVMRDEAGEFVATSDLPAPIIAINPDENANGVASTLYASIYYAGLLQDIPQDTILRILRVHAYETDFRKRIRAGDMVELFFEGQDQVRADGPPGELLYARITSGGETKRFYRHRTDDGEIDYYDDRGDNSKRFLMRKPVRGASVRLTSGFGMRFHPLLNKRRMHAGVDWAAPSGTPVLAAGRGTIVFAGRKGQYGNYVRIQHANGYQSAYAHLRRFGRGVKAGSKVRQGQVIGYVGSTGLSSGPHLHYEVLVNKRRVNPMKLKVPRERKLAGRELVQFQSERTRLDELMRSAPVKMSSK